MSAPKVEEGTIPFNPHGTKSTYHTWFKTVGEIKKSIPLIMIHGGPGAGHSDLLTLALPLERAGIPVICYDQVGCGHSSLIREKSNDPDFWSFDLFCAELDNIIDYFGLRESGFYIHGHSWGGMLASTYAARRSRGLRRLVISCSTASAAIYAREAEWLFRSLSNVDDAVMRMEAEGKYEAPEYKEACAAFLKRYFCRLDPWPDVLNEGGKCFQECTMFNSLWGSSRIHMVGTLKTYDAATEAGNISVPTLLLSGRHDYMTEAMMKPWYEAINEVEWEILENSSHMPHLEEPERYLELLKKFLLFSLENSL